MRYPGRGNFMVWRFVPVGPEETYEEFDFFFESATPTEAEMEAIRYIDEVLQPEDIDLVESVQRGMRTPAFERGRYVVDPQGSGSERARGAPLPRSRARGLPPGRRRVMSAGASAVREGYLAGKVAVVTGGLGGIGTAVCARFAAEGAAVYATGLSEPAADADAGAEAGTDAAPGVVVFHRHDVTSEESTVELMARVAREHGRLDVLVNAAGIEIEKTVEDTSLAEWNRIFAVNVTGTFLTSKHALPLMRRAGGGSVINFGSYEGFIADPNLAAYCATKGAVHALTRAMA